MKSSMYQREAISPDYSLLAEKTGGSIDSILGPQTNSVGNVPDGGSAGRMDLESRGVVPAAHSPDMLGIGH